MALISSNTLEIRRVMQRDIDINGKISYFENLQYRTKDVVISILGVSLGSWSAWQSLDRTDLIYVDENGNPV
jgi:hypothetical protein